MDKTSWEKFRNEVVVVDTDSVFVYLGTLDRLEGEFIVLRDADAHDRAEGPSTKEQYVMDARRFGIHPNRKEVRIRMEKIVSLSRLADVIVY
ncbi:MAG: hypothetical protein ACK44W_17735 [Planctomycetota bacterium]